MAKRKAGQGMEAAGRFIGAAELKEITEALQAAGVVMNAFESRGLTSLEQVLHVIDTRSHVERAMGAVAEHELTDAERDTRMTIRASVRDTVLDEKVAALMAALEGVEVEPSERRMLFEVGSLQWHRVATAERDLRAHLGLAPYPGEDEATEAAED